MRSGFRGILIAFASHPRRNPLLSANPTPLAPPLPSFSPFFTLIRFLSSSSSSLAIPGVESQGMEWPAKKVRDTFIEFFKEKNHENFPSSPVVPVNDPTLLFANAGTFTFFSNFGFVFSYLFLVREN